jgi:hypothetical protein
VAHVSHGSWRIGDLRRDVSQATFSIARVTLTDRGNRATATTHLARLLGLTTTRLARLATTTAQVCGAELVVPRADGTHIRCVIGRNRSGTHTNGIRLVKSLTTSTATGNLLAATAT